MIHDGTQRRCMEWHGIVTSETAAHGSGAALTTLAIATAGDVGFGGTKTLRRTNRSTTTDTLVMYTYAGDTNLDGQINGDDYFRIDQRLHLRGRQRLRKRRLELRWTHRRR